VQGILDELVRRRRDGEWESRVAIVNETVSMAAFDPVRRNGEPMIS
jgi:hypothetical protein